MTQENISSADLWSSVEYSTFGSALARELTQRGVRCSMRYEISQREYWAARTPLSRLRLRALAYGIYPLRLAGELTMAKRHHTAIVSTNTFYAPALALAVAAQVPVVHWVLDLFPDVLVTAGKLKTGSFAERTLKKLVKATFAKAAANVFLGEHLLDYARKEFGYIPRARIIPIGADGSRFRNRRPGPAAEPTRILYCGNFGRMHEENTLLSYFERHSTPLNVEFLFRGNGSGFRELERRAFGTSRVSFGANLEGDQWVSTMLAAQIALVTMRRGAEGVVMPSKTYSALAAGQAILAICPVNSDLGDLVKRHSCGWVVEPGDITGLNAVIAHIAENPDDVLIKRRAAYAAGHDRYDQSMLAVQWVDLLQTVDKFGCGASRAEC